MSTALENLDAALVSLTSAANNAALRLNDLGANSVPAADVQVRAEAISNLATALQTAVDNNTPKV